MSKRNQTLKDILDLILHENPSTQDEIAEKLGITRRYVTQLLKPLVEDGTVKRGYMVDLKSYEKFLDSYGGNIASEGSAGNIFVNDMVRNMVKHIHNQLECSFNALQEHDEIKANEALEMDFITNNMVEKIRTSIETIAIINKHTEFSKSVLYNEVAYELERIGDYCGHIAKFVLNDVYKIEDDILKYLNKMYKKSQKMIRSSMIAFLDGETDLKEEILDMQESLQILQSKAINLIATGMAENPFDEIERSNYFIYLFRVVKAFKGIGNTSVEIADIALEFHNNIPRSTTPRTFR
ncbi:PhoU domain-containing protein [uncultured Methanobrevibacter sp.]|uniref:PhoU domain-containing protein n=1 Tax=uncultured Methanobrevibacter sp. TaxID=253161 RepID=UPI0015BA323C|nr:PhoU domain-containing protein [uncultured Methanobrevibacter sp.]